MYSLVFHSPRHVEPPPYGVACIRPYPYEDAPEKKNIYAFRGLAACLTEHSYDKLKRLIALECHNETSARIHEKAQNS